MANNDYWKKKYADYHSRSESRIAELKAENERLKAEIKNNKSAYQVELGTYNMECGNLLKENENLLQTLQEIKKIAEEINNDIKILYNRKLHNGLRKILQLIESEEE